MAICVLQHSKEFGYNFYQGSRCSTILLKQYSLSLSSSNRNFENVTYMLHWLLIEKNYTFHLTLYNRIPDPNFLEDVVIFLVHMRVDRGPDSVILRIYVSQQMKPCQIQGKSVDLSKSLVQFFKNSCAILRMSSLVWWFQKVQ